LYRELHFPLLFWLYNTIIIFYVFQVNFQIKRLLVKVNLYKFLKFKIFFLIFSGRKYMLNIVSCGRTSVKCRDFWWGTINARLEKKVAIGQMYICKEPQIFFKALELIAWLSHSNLSEKVIFWVASTRTLLTRHCSICGIAVLGVCVCGAPIV